MSDQDWGAVGFWVEQVWPTWCGGHQGKGCCHKDDSLAQGKACCNSKVICVSYEIEKSHSSLFRVMKMLLTIFVTRCGDWGTVVVTNKEK